MPPRTLPFLLTVLPALALLAAGPVAARTQCGQQGPWVQVLGSGAADRHDANASGGVLLWQDGVAIALVDPGPGSALRMAETGANPADLDAIALTRVGLATSADLPSVLYAAQGSARTERLAILGPAGGAGMPATTELLGRLLGADGAWPEQAGWLADDAAGYRISARDVPATGRRRWAQFGTARLALAAMPSQHGDLPALAWRAQFGGRSVVVTGASTNQNLALTELARGADALVVHHELPIGARGAALATHMTPEQIGKLAADANIGMLILANRGERTLGREAATREAIAARFQGTILFATDRECWGL